MNENIKKYGKVAAWIILPTVLIALISLFIYMKKKKIGVKQLPGELKSELKNIDLKKKLGLKKQKKEQDTPPTPIEQKGLLNTEDKKADISSEQIDNKSLENKETEDDIKN